MNKQRIPQRIGIIFLLITICATNIASGQQKNNSTTIDNLKLDRAFKVYTRNTSYPDSDGGSAAALVTIKEVKNRGLQCIAVDKNIFPYGSVIVGQDKQGQRIVGVAVDTGPWVIQRKAAKNLAKKLGYSADSREAKAPVFDFHKNPNLHYWDYFIVIPYTGPDFKFSLSKKEKLAYLDKVKKQFVENPSQLLASTP